MFDFPAASEFQSLIDLAVREDLGPERRDVTSELTVPASMRGTGTLYQKAAGVVCGLPIIPHVCRAFDPDLVVEMPWPDREGRLGDGAITPLARLRGSMRSILSAERTVLNFVQRMSGIATATHAYVQLVKGTTARVLDTRKTLPGYRALDKYAVRAGGGHNHRIGLYDMVLVKDNHLAQLGPDAWAARLEKFVQESRAKRPSLPVEVEVVSFDQCERVLAMPGVDIVLLDNMDLATMSRCVAARDAAGVNGRVQLEASGGITHATIAGVARVGVDRISVGALTHSVTALDISLEVEAT